MRHSWNSDVRSACVDICQSHWRKFLFNFVRYFLVCFAVRAWEGDRNIFLSILHCVHVQKISWSLNTTLHQDGCEVLDPRVCRHMSSCLFACLSICFSRKPHVQISPNFLHTCYTWLWLGPPLTAMRYVIHFRFCGWRDVFIIIIQGRWHFYDRLSTTQGIRQNQRRHDCFVQFARWRHRWSPVSPIASCWDMQAKKKTDRQTDTLITKLYTPTGSKATNRNQRPTVLLPQCRK